MTFNPWTFFLEVINFLALVYVLRRLLYRPLSEAIERRRADVTRRQAEAEKARAEAEAIKEEIVGKLAKLDREREETISRVRQQAEGERKKILDEAERAAQRRQEEACRSLARDREEMLRSLSGEVVTQTLNLAERLLRQAADTTMQAQLEKHLLEDLDSLPEDQREQLRRDWGTEDMAWLETAAQPGGETSKRFTEAITRLAGRELALNERNNPALIGGVRLRIGGLLWDASIAGQLEVAPAPQQEVTNHG